MTAQVHSDRSLSIYNLMSRAESADARDLFSRLSREDPVHWDPYAGVWLVAERSAAERVFTGDEFGVLRTSDVRQCGGDASRVDALGSWIKARITELELLAQELEEMAAGDPPGS